MKTNGFTRALPLPWGGGSTPSVFLLFVSFILMVLSSVKPHWFEHTRTYATDSFAPVLSVASMPFENFALFLHDMTGLAQLQADNKRLESENKKLREWYQMALLLESENKSLRKLLNMAPMPEYDHIGARVLSDTGTAYAKSVLVHAGKDKQVSKGNAVLSGEGLIGRVIEVSDKTSRILMVTDLNSRVPVVVENTKQHAIMAGTNTKHPKLTHLLQDGDLSKKSRIITSGYGGVYPRGLPVGIVEISASGDYQVNLFADMDALHEIKILKEKGRSVRD